MVLNPALEAEARAVFDKWDLDFAIIGETIAEDRFLILHKGAVKPTCPCLGLPPPPPNTTGPGCRRPRPRPTPTSRKSTPSRASRP
jgi:phosphoribosylformylglycinamidine synthase subunit PurL